MGFILAAVLFITLFICGVVLFFTEDVSTIAQSENTEPPYKSVEVDVYPEEIRKTFLSQNIDFPNLILTNVLSEGSKGNPWVLSVEKATYNRVRTVFIGYHDIYVFVDTPYFGAGPIENRYPYPQTFCVINGGRDVLHHTYLRIGYADDLGYAAIDDYHGVPKHHVLGWIAEDIRTKFQALHPEMKVNEVAYAKENPSYYYFTYEVPGIQLSGWK